MFQEGNLTFVFLALPAGEVFPLEKAHEAIAAHSTAGRSAKVFLKSE